MIKTRLRDLYPHPLYPLYPLLKKVEQNLGDLEQNLGIMDQKDAHQRSLEQNLGDL